MAPSKKDFIDVDDFSGGQLQDLLDRAIADKDCFRAGKLVPSLPRKALAMIFEKPSLRTRVSFETAMTQLGGHALYLTQADIGLGSREDVPDIARVLGRMCNGIMARTFSHEFVRNLARFAPAPVINGLTDRSHPCQAMADLMTVQERLGTLAGRKLAFVGDGSNVARSLASACERLGMEFVPSCPGGYELRDAPSAVVVVRDPSAAVAGADVVCTDTWVSMGLEGEKEKRVRDFQGFQVNAALLARAPRHAIVLHSLPAYRGYEISDETFEAHAGTILEEAENRLHFQRTLLNVLIGEGGVA